MKITTDSLVKALRAYRKATLEIAELRSIAADRKAEYVAALKKIDPRDERAVNSLSGREIQGRMASHQAENTERELEGLIAPVFNAADSLDAALRQAAAEEREELRGKIAGVLRPFCRDFFVSGARVDAAHQVAGGSNILSICFPQRLGTCTLPPGHRSANPAQFDSEVLARAEELLAIHAAWEKNGRSFAANFSIAPVEE
jgi:hypothetical protein